ncbi:hypothetical protein D3C83_60390 [compost metagenome]
MHIDAVQHVTFHVEAAGAAFLLEHHQDRFFAALPRISALGLEIAGVEAEEMLIRITGVRRRNRRGR